MIEAITKNIIKRMLRSDIILEEDKDVYVYGLDIIISSILTFIIVILIGLITFGLPTAIVYLITTAPLRLYGGGWHAKTHFSCTLIQCISFIIVTFASSIAANYSNLIVLLALHAICFLIIVIKAPSEHPDNPLNEASRTKAKRNCLLIECLITIVVIAVFLLGESFYSTLISLSAISAIGTFLFQNKTV